MMVAEKTSEAQEIRGQISLFPEVTNKDIELTLSWLKRYTEMKACVKDYEENAEELKLALAEGESARRLSVQDLHADKTSNAVILAEKQKAIYEEYKVRIDLIRRATALIHNVDARNAVSKRYLEGFSYKEMIFFFQRGRSDRTIERKLNEGVISVANTLKLRGAFECEWKY